MTLWAGNLRSSLPVPSLASSIHRLVPLCVERAVLVCSALGAVARRAGAGPSLDPAIASAVTCVRDDEINLHTRVGLAVPCIAVAVRVGAGEYVARTHALSRLCLSRVSQESRSRLRTRLLPGTTCPSVAPLAALRYSTRTKPRSHSRSPARSRPARAAGRSRTSERARASPGRTATGAPYTPYTVTRYYATRSRILHVSRNVRVSRGRGARAPGRAAGVRSEPPDARASATAACRRRRCTAAGLWALRTHTHTHTHCALRPPRRKAQARPRE